MSNFHPLIVHFPIALFITGFAVDGLGWLLRRENLKRVGLVLILLGALAAVPTVATGLAVEETVEKQLEGRPGAEAALEAHESLAIYTAIVLLGVAVLRLVLGTGWLERQRVWMHGLLVAYLVVGTLGLGLLTLTGYRGGELVYRYGAGVEAPPFTPASTFQEEND